MNGKQYNKLSAREEAFLSIARDRNISIKNIIKNCFEKYITIRYNDAVINKPINRGGITICLIPVHGEATTIDYIINFEDLELFSNNVPSKFHVGIASCSFKDNFNIKKGKYISRGRAFQDPHVLILDNMKDISLEKIVLNPVFMNFAKKIIVENLNTFDFAELSRLAHPIIDLYSQCTISINGRNFEEYNDILYRYF